MEAQYGKAEIGEAGKNGNERECGKKSSRTRGVSCGASSTAGCAAGKAFVAGGKSKRGKKVKRQTVKMLEIASSFHSSQ